ncbi:DUF262 domain-containing protein [Rhizobium ruizarguesonis]
MKDLDGKTISVGKLLSENTFLRVPDYQRPFSWDPDNFEDLIDDLSTADFLQQYFLGTIVLHYKEKDNLYDIVDGQQRLTSLMILLACLRDKSRRRQYEKKSPEQNSPRRKFCGWYTEENQT